ncbi:protein DETOXIFICATION 46, chloroplastic isoform X1 [Dendrobium catenatum]|uniref:protein DETOXIFICATION 46, chloroplastic isoform X1 n=1 Tax=Dendrobium catenatum TaxID=906689 RepID=UPI00109F8A32|nr:protein DETOXIFICATION 46, chloroplastic isoform X1 [Dendrobium catenatum]
MALRLFTSPILLSPHRPFVQPRHTAHDGGGGLYLSLRRRPPPTLTVLPFPSASGLNAECSSQDTVVFVSDVDPPEAPAAIDAFEGELDSGQLTILQQMKDIVMFAGPATGLWISGPLMSLIDTMVIGQGSSLELAALGPGTVFLDNLSYIFMFLSISTSNLVATSLAKKDNALAQNQISMLLFIAFTSGLGMFLFTKLFGSQILTAFSGSGNVHLVSAANSYIQIRGLAWPAILVGMVAQSASLGMKDSWGPLKALTVASAVNGLGDVILCSICGYGIAGAAWATMFSQVIAAFMMVTSLNKTGFRVFSISIPSQSDFLQVYEIAAPVFATMTAKVAFYSLLTYFATSMGTITVAAHQVMVNIFCMCTVWGEPLSQSAQSFMPELIHGVNRSLFRARILLKSLVIIGAIAGLTLGIIGTSLPWSFPNFFTADCIVIGEMHKVLLPFFIALMITPATHSLEGTLLAGRDLRFLSLSMTGCFCFGGLLVLLASSRGFGLPGCWWGLAIFQWGRFSMALQRLTSPYGMLYNEQFHQRELTKLEGA